MVVGQVQVALTAKAFKKTNKPQRFGLRSIPRFANLAVGILKAKVGFCEEFIEKVLGLHRIVEVFAATSCYSPWTDLNKVGIFLHSWS